MKKYLLILFSVFAFVGCTNEEQATQITQIEVTSNSSLTAPSDEVYSLYLKLVNGNDDCSLLKSVHTHPNNDHTAVADLSVPIEDDHVLDSDKPLININVVDKISISEGITPNSIDVIKIGLNNIDDSDVKNAINIAIDYWNTVLDKKVFVIDDSDNQVQVCLNDFQNVDKDFIGFTYATAGTDKNDVHCIIDVGVTGKNWWQVYTHELGHCLGLTHSDSIYSVMYGQVLPNQRLTQTDVDLVNTKIDR